MNGIVGSPKGGKKGDGKKWKKVGDNDELA